MKATNIDRYDQVEKLNLPYTVQVWYKLSDKDDSLFDGEEPEEWWFKTYKEAKLQFDQFYIFSDYNAKRFRQPEPTHLILMKYGYCNDPESGDCMDEWDIDGN